MLGVFHLRGVKINLVCNCELMWELCWNFRPLCWLEHLTLHNETGLDPPGIRVRAVPGLVAADYFAPGYFVWAVLIENLARIGYEGKNLYMAAYDWRLSFQNTEVSKITLSDYLLVIAFYQPKTYVLLCY